MDEKDLTLENNYCLQRKKSSSFALGTGILNGASGSDVKWVLGFRTLCSSSEVNKEIFSTVET